MSEISDMHIDLGYPQKKVVIHLAALLPVQLFFKVKEIRTTEKKNCVCTSIEYPVT